MKSDDKPFKVVVIGTSMGGLKALRTLVSDIRPELNAAYFIVQHLAEHHKSLLPKLLSAHTKLTCKVAENEESIVAGTVYVSPNNKHLMIRDNHIVLGDGARENSARPSIDNLFRSAAIYYQERVIGVILTGLLSDGSKGLSEIKKYGGTAIVQTPDDAEYNEMPVNAINATEVDFVVSLTDIGALLKILIDQHQAPANMKRDPEILQHLKVASDKLKENIDFSRENMEVRELDQDADVYESLLSILQIMQERTNMLENVAEENLILEKKHIARMYFERYRESRMHTENLQRHLYRTYFKKMSS